MIRRTATILAALALAFGLAAAAPAAQARDTGWDCKGCFVGH